MTARLHLTILVDNTIITDRDFHGEAGLSFFVETAGKKILFDTGLSGMFLANAEKMGIDLGDLDFLILSHGHIDHTGGLAGLSRHLAVVPPGGSRKRMPHLIAHPRCFWPKEKDGRKNGSAESEEEIRRHFPVSLSAKPVWITEDLVFLGEIPRIFPFEKTAPGTRKILFPDGKSEADLLLDDSALAFRSGAGLVIITGCSHAGICNITRYAREVCGEKQVSAIIGGLHLMASDQERTKVTGEFLHDLKLDALHACHCTSFAAKLELAKSCPIREAGVGMHLEW